MNDRQAIMDIEWVDGDVVVYIDGKEVAWATYDLHGSGGVEAVADCARNIAKATNLVIYEMEV